MANEKRILFAGSRKELSFNPENILKKNGYDVFEFCNFLSDSQKISADELTPVLNNHISRNQIDLVVFLISSENNKNVTETIVQTAKRLKSQPDFHFIVAVDPDQHDIIKKFKQTGALGFFFTTSGKLQFVEIIESAFLLINRDRMLQKRDRKIKRTSGELQNLNKLFINNNMVSGQHYSLRVLYNAVEEKLNVFFDIRQNEHTVGIVFGECSGEISQTTLDHFLLKVLTQKYKDILLNENPAEFLNRVNYDICEYFENTKFMKMIALSLQIFDRRITVANSDICPVFYNDLHQIHTFRTNQRPIVGYDKKIIFKQKSFYSDKNSYLFFSDSQNINDSKENTEDVWKPFLKKIRRKDISDNEILELFHKHSQNRRNLNRETFFLCLRFLPGKNVNHTIYTHKEKDRFLKEIETILFYYGYSAEQTEMILIGADEMMINGLTHGNKNNPDLKLSITLSVFLNQVKFYITDEGEGFNPKTVPDPTDPERLKKLIENGDEKAFTHGRGIFVTKEYMDHIQYNSKGNGVFIAKMKEPTDISYGKPVKFQKITYSGKLKQKPEKTSDGWLLDLSDRKAVSSAEIKDILLLFKSQKENPFTIKTGSSAVYNILKGSRLEAIGIKILSPDKII